MEIVKTPNGYSTGWTENTRNEFTPSALFLIATGYSGLTNASLVEATELVLHYYENKRERCQPYAGANGSIFGFFFNVGGYFRSFKKELEESQPNLFTYFNNQENIKTWLKLCQEDPQPKEEIKKVADQICEDFVNDFGRSITILPSSEKKIKDYSSFLLIKQENKINEDYCVRFGKGITI